MEAVDGRRARRERGRLAVIDAMFELLEAGQVPVSAEMVAERSGVSVASVFRYFDGLDDLQYQTFERFRERFALPLLSAETPGADAVRTDRIRSFVAARLDLYERAGEIMAVGRLRALEHAPLAEASGQMRSLLADQVSCCFAADVAGVTPTRAAGLVAMIDALTSLDAWDVMRKTHSRSPRQIAQAWERAIDALVKLETTGGQR